PFLGYHLDGAALIGASDAARARLACVEAALRVECIAGRTVRVGAEDLDVVTGGPLHQAIARCIAEDQVSILRPSRSFSEAVAERQLFELHWGEVLRPHCGRERRRRDPTCELHFFPGGGVAPLSVMPFSTCFTPFCFFASFSARDRWPG